ncbi:kyphoscoliosis peptidase-like isoform X1 [Ruditapes philippinarum]|uniref:kyphoscoliosis peptidase-like isoform X1 n=1 Tax=Ruditapes philippinarum TaxID=129788 RepID=UPI00295C3A48|nr:kyphoscoliosis peptidase-like isoform X1 [Ruditapes philippinarum]
MKKTRLIRVQSFNIREEGVDWNGNQRSNSFTGFGNTVTQNTNSQPSILKRQHSFAGSMTRQSSFAGSSRQNSFLRALPGSRQNSYCRTRSRGSTGSSYTYSTTSSGISSGNHSEISDSSGSGAKSSLSRELSYGLLTDFADIEEKDEDIKTARESNPASRNSNDSLRPPSGRRSNGPRGTSGQSRDREKRRGQTQVHGLGVASAEAPHTPLRKIEEDALPNVEGMESKVMVRSRPDSGIAVSTSSASYSSSELHKERDLDVDDHYHTTSCQEMLDKVAKVLPDQHNDLKSLVAAVTKGLNSVHSKAQALYCWLTSQNVANFEKSSKKSNSPSGRLKHIHEKKATHCSMYMDMLKIAGLRCERVDGYMKTSDYLPGNTVQTPKFQHSWVAVCMDGHYRLVDPQYGALGDKFVQEHYFATSPDELLLSHFPKDKKWLLMNQPATIEGFEGTLKTWPAMFHFNIRPLNMKSVIRTYDGKLSITVLLQNVAVNPQLEYAGPGPEIDMDTLEEKIDHEIRDVDNAETYHVTLPQEGNYYFTVYAHVLEDCVDVPVFQYRIEYVDELL